MAPKHYGFGFCIDRGGWLVLTWPISGGQIVVCKIIQLNLLHKLPFGGGNYGGSQNSADSLVLEYFFAIFEKFNQNVSKWSRRLHHFNGVSQFSEGLLFSSKINIFAFKFILVVGDRNVSQSSLTYCNFKYSEVPQAGLLETLNAI